ncbi:transposase, partial [Salmonella enterica]|nr:transposase [Salmonella enterica]
MERLRQQEISLQERDTKIAALMAHIRQLKDAIALNNRLRFGRSAETFTGLQGDLFAEDVDTDTAALETQLAALLPPEDKPRKTPPKRRRNAVRCRRPCRAKRYAMTWRATTARTAAVNCASSATKSASGWSTCLRA